MKDLKITKGECTLNLEMYDAKTASSWISVEVGEARIAEFKGRHYGIPHHEVKANAELFVDTHATAQKCGLLPSELLKQRDGLLKKIKTLEFMIEKGLGWEDMQNDITMPREI